MKRCLVIASLLVVSPAPAREFHVRAGAQAAGANGTLPAPYPTLTEALSHVAPGDTVTVAGGRYRETIRVPSGTAEKPVTLKAAPGERVILSGAVRVTDWRLSGEHVYTTTLDFRPERLLADDQTLPLAREPNEGWWRAATARDLTLTDPDHLRAFPAQTAGAQAYVWTQHGNTFFTVPIASLDGARGALTVTRQSKWMRLTDGDRYYLENSPDFIDAPGEWSVQPDGHQFRLQCRPRTPADLEHIEAPRESRRVLLVSRATNVWIEGLAIVASGRNGIEVNRSENVVITGCVVHHHGGTGIAIRDCRSVRVRRNIVGYNHSGITLHTARDAVVEENEIGYNRMDGLVVSWNSADITVRRNYVHHHLLWGHPDNIQLYREVKNIRFIDNLLIAGGQSVMMEETSDGVLAGNMILGSGAYSVIFGHHNAEHYRLTHNTIAFAGYGCLSLTARDYDLRDNIFVTGHNGRAYGVRGISGYTGDHNLFFKADLCPDDSVLVSDQSWNSSVARFRQATGQEAHSRYGNPQFRNAPIAFGVTDTRRLPESTRDTWFLRKGHGPIQLGDLVEVNFDGVPRKVTALTDDRITVAPGLKAKPLKGLLLCNWGANTNLQLDLRLKATSPQPPGAKGPVGSRINIAAYQRGDFDEDGVRDLPAPEWENWAGK